MPKSKPTIQVQGDHVEYKHVDYQIGDIASGGIGVNIVNSVVDSQKKLIPEEQLFRFLAPGLDDEEKQKVHRQVADLVSRFSLPEIGKYLSYIERDEKIYIKNANLDRLHEELVRLGMPNCDNDGFSIDNFKKYIRP